METFGQRLRWAIENRGPGRGGRPRGRNRPGSIRAFHIALKESGAVVRGSSYQMLHRYLADETTPPPDFIAAAAKLLGVRPEWLATGEGEPTAEHGLEARAGAKALASGAGLEPGGRMLHFDDTPAGRRLAEVERHIVRGLGAWGMPQRSPAVAVLVRAWRKLWMSAFLRGEMAGLDDEGLQELDKELAFRVGRAAAAPLRELGAVGRLEEEPYQDYLVGMAALLARTIRDARPAGAPPNEGLDDGEA